MRLARQRPRQSQGKPWACAATAAEWMLECSGPIEMKRRFKALCVHWKQSKSSKKGSSCLAITLPTDDSNQIYLRWNRDAKQNNVYHFVRQACSTGKLHLKLVQQVCL